MVLVRMVLLVVSFVACRGPDWAHRSSYSVLRAVCVLRWEKRDAASIRALDRSSASGGTPAK